MPFSFSPRKRQSACVPWETRHAQEQPTPQGAGLPHNKAPLACTLFARSEHSIRCSRFSQPLAQPAKTPNSLVPRTHQTLIHNPKTTRRRPGQTPGATPRQAPRAKPRPSAPPNSQSLISHTAHTGHNSQSRRTLPPQQRPAKPAPGAKPGNNQFWR